MIMTPKFEKLFQPIRIRQMEVKNRIVMAPVNTNYASDDGYVTQQQKDYYEVRARGGAGLIIVEGSCVVFPDGKNLPRQLSVDDDKFIPGLRELVQAIHRHGAKAVLQLHHAGGAAKASVIHTQPVAPSAVPFWLPGTALPRELTIEEIRGLIGRFAQAAERAKRAGFDGVQVHGANYYLIAEFLSRAYNRRQDEYGGDLRNRARFLLEVIAAVRNAVGKDYPMMCRLTGIEYETRNGITIEETKEVVRMAEQAGIDAIGLSPTGMRSHLDLPYPLKVGDLLPLSKAIKEAVGIPVEAVGRITPELGDKLLRDGEADLIAMGRRLIVDPELPGKVASGRLDEIAPCIACLECVNSIGFEGEAMRCTVNPAVGREREYAITPAARPKKVLVVGGGPAGLEAARVAAIRGHQVTLYEKDNSLGGQLRLAAMAPGKADISSLAQYLTNQVRKAGVRVELGKEVTPDSIQMLQPDVVVLAVGVTPIIPEIPGIDRGNVVLVEDVLSGQAEVGDRTVVLGGELVGCEAADFLSEQGKKVTVTRRGPRMATKMMPILRRLLLDRLTAKGVTMLTGVQYNEITAEGLVITTKEGRRQLLEADTVVLAAGSQSNDKLSRAIAGKVPQARLVGDCVEPRDILSAIVEGATVGREI